MDMIITFLCCIAGGLTGWGIGLGVEKLISRAKKSKEEVNSIETDQYNVSSYGASRTILLDNEKGPIGECCFKKKDYLDNPISLVGRYVTIKDSRTDFHLVSGIVLSEQIGPATEDKKDMVYEMYIYTESGIVQFLDPVQRDVYSIETLSGKSKLPIPATKPRDAIDKFCSSQCIIECTKDCILKTYRRDV